MEKNFKDFINNIQLTDAQRADAKTKYEGVIDCLAHEFYDRDANSNDQFLFGSYKTKTNITPMDEMQDVDVVFKITPEIQQQYNDNPEALLQRCKKALQKKYPTTDKIRPWVNVILVKFTMNHHNVEVLPCLDQDNGIFLIPDSSKGGYWKDVDYRGQIDSFTDSNSKTNNLTRELDQMLKEWVRYTKSLDYHSYNLLNDVISYLQDVYPKGKENYHYDDILKGFFDYKIARTVKSDSIYSCLETAQKRAVKAIEYEKEGKHIEASVEWRKIFGNQFPKSEKNEETANREHNFGSAPSPWYSD